MVVQFIVKISFYTFSEIDGIATSDFIGQPAAVSRFVPVGVLGDRRKLRIARSSSGDFCAFSVG
jgi:hypothetical protein